MKIKFCSTLLFILLNLTFFSQNVPKLVNYQAIAYDINGNALNQQDIVVKIGILKGLSSSVLLYEEEHSITTASNGLFNLKIGNGTSTGNGTSNQFGNVVWDDDDFYLNVQLNVGNGFENLGTQQLVSVPFAFRAKKAEFVTNPGTFINAGNNITINGTGESTNPYVVNGNVVLSTLANNTLSGTFDYANEAGLLTTIDYKTYINAGNNISVSGNGLTSNPYLISSSFTEVDGDTSNELNTGFSISAGGNLVLTDAGGSFQVPLAWIKDGNDLHSNNSGNVGIGITNPTEKLHLYGGTLKIDNGTNPYKLPPSDGIANQYLKTNGAGNVSWASLPTVSGPDGDWTIDGSDIYSGVSGNVGIGTSTPGEKLSLSYDSYIGWEYSSTNNSYAHKIGKQPGFAEPLDFETSFNPGPNGPIFRFREMNSTGDVMTILYNGNIGIGTSNPSAKLDVVGTLQYVDGNEAPGKILTTDANGNSAWASNSIYTESGPLNNTSITVNDTWQPTNCSFTVNKNYNDSKLEITFNSNIYAGIFGSASAVVFEIRIDGNSPDFDNHGAITNSGTTKFISMFAVFDNLSAGTYTVDVYTKTDSGNSLGVAIDSDLNGGKMIVKETF